MAVLSKRLAQVNESLNRKIASRNEYEKTIQETEAAYTKVSHLTGRTENIKSQCFRGLEDYRLCKNLLNLLDLG